MKITVEMLVRKLLEVASGGSRPQMVPAVL